MGETAPLFFCGLFGGLLLLGGFLGWLGERSSGRSSIGRVAFNPDQIDSAAFKDERIQEALDKGNKIEAIKVYREQTGLGLKEAKDAIEYAQANPDIVGEKKKRASYDKPDAGIRDLVEEGRIDEAIEVYQKFAGVDEYTAMDAVADIEHDLRQSESAEVSDIDDRVRNLALEGKKIEAIKLYCEMTGLGLKEAKDAVEGMARGGAVGVMSEKQFDVILIALKDRVEIMKAIMSLTPVGLKGSKDMADNPPAVVLRSVSRSKADEAKQVLEQAGGTVEVRLS